MESETLPGCIELYTGSALDVLRHMAAVRGEFVDCVVTSPPYLWQRDYGTGAGRDARSPVLLSWVRQHIEERAGDDTPPGLRAMWRRFSRHFSDFAGRWGAPDGRMMRVWRNWRRRFPDRAAADTIPDLPYSLARYGPIPSLAWYCRYGGELGLEPHYTWYIAHLVEVFRVVRQVLKPTGTVWLNLGDTYMGSGGAGSWARRKGGGYVQRRSDRSAKRGDVPDKCKLLIPHRVAIALEEDGWWVRNDLVWFKSADGETAASMPASVTDRLKCAHEAVFLLAKAPRYYFNLAAIKRPLKSLPRVEKSASPNAFRIGGGKAPGYGRRQYSGSAGWADRTKAAALRAGGAVEYQEHRVPIAGGNALSMPADGANPGDVWNIPVEPFAGGHFATMPTELYRRCILAGCPAEVCPRCGEPRVAVVRKGAARRHRAPGADSGPGSQPVTMPPQRPSGWWPAEMENVEYRSCACDAGFVPGVFLDPFAGSGKGLLTSMKLGRRAVGIELNPRYAVLIREQVRGVAGQLTLALDGR